MKNIPKPNHPNGYTREELQIFMNDNELKRFHKFMFGQTVMIDNQQRILYYPQDVQRFLELGERK